MVLHREAAQNSQEIWKKQNKEAITRALHEMLSRPHPQSKKGGLDSIPLKLFHFGETVEAKLCYEAMLTSDDHSDVDAYIHGRLSLFPQNVPVQKHTLPADGISLRPQEISSLDAFIVPAQESGVVVHARNYSSTNEDWQQHGIGKTLLIEGLEDFALHLIKNDTQFAKNTKKIVFTVRDASSGVGNIQLDNWTTKVMNEWNSSRPQRERYTQIAPDVFQKVVTLPD